MLGFMAPKGLLPPLTVFMLSLLPDQLRRILLEQPELGQAFLVGGCVRDALVGLPIKDFDVEVFALLDSRPEDALDQH